MNKLEIFGSSSRVRGRFLTIKWFLNTISGIHTHKKHTVVLRDGQRTRLMNVDYNRLDETACLLAGWLLIIIGKCGEKKNPVITKRYAHTVQ